ncbi:hypothetical protein U9M48_027046 [Paspalum notatum var. saurae]|uniref:Uncharacterized protein n=1 Tax=Paspalum notatum var. saurae TaxID=547442 RepID=A0AAQ3TYN6_PASNO
MMGSRRWQSPAAAAAAAEASEEDTGGAGGPSRRQPRLGLHRASPYGGGPRRWLPKPPVASRIFPTMPRDHVASDNNQEVHHESLEVIHERHSTEPNINAVATVPTTSVSTRFNLLLEGDGNPSQGDEDEAERITEILRSRTTDFNVEGQRAPESIAKGFENTAFSTPAKLIDPQTSLGTDSFPSSNVHDVGSSPIEIAKAFMEARTSASVHESQKRKFRALSHGVDESVHESKKRKFRALSHEVEVDNSTSKVFPTVATDSSVCWPGSVVRGYPNYVTPQSNKGRTPPQPVSCKPYNGSVFRRSIKNSRRGDTYNNSSGRPQFSTPFSVGSKAVLEDKQVSTSGGMVQPSPSSRGHIYVFGSSSSFFPREGSADKKNVAFNLQAPDDKGTTEGRAAIGHADVNNISRGVSVSVHPKSSETAFKILKQLERTIPSPALKPLDLRQTLAKRNAASVATNSLARGPEFNTINGHRQSSPNKSGNANLEITDANKAQEPQSTPDVVESSEKIQSSGANSEVCETHTSHQPLKSSFTSTSAAEVLDKNTSKGFTFTFPVPKAPSSLLEPPPTPTLASPPRTLPITTEDIPKYTIGSSSTANRLVFSFNSTSGSLGADGTVPTFKIGSGNKRELCFDRAVKDSVCF